MNLELIFIWQTYIGTLDNNLAACTSLICALLAIIALFLVFIDLTLQKILKALNDKNRKSQKNNEWSLRW